MSRHTHRTARTWRMRSCQQRQRSAAVCTGASQSLTSSSSSSVRVTEQPAMSSEVT